MLGKKKRGDKIAESDRNVKFFVAGIIFSILLIAYVFIVIRALSKNAETVFPGFFDSLDSTLEYDFESFEKVFPGKLDELSGEIDFNDANTGTSIGTTTDTATSTATVTSTTENASSSIDANAHATPAN
jgi:hypothetical protein